MCSTLIFITYSERKDLLRKSGIDITLEELIIQGILLIVNSSVGIYLSNTSFFIFGITDAAIKFFIGIALFIFSPKAEYIARR